MAHNMHSTGRGGAGNIGDGEGTYVDGQIVREGVSNPEVTHVGRGGQGNIGSPRVGPQTVGNNRSEDVVPEPAMRTAEGHENFHTGRGGGGNVYKEKYGGHSHPQHEKDGKESVIDKAKHALGLDHKKEGTPERK